MQHLYRATVEVLLDDAERDRLAALDDLGFPVSSKVLFLMTRGRKPYEHQSDPNVYFNYKGVWCEQHQSLTSVCHPHPDHRSSDTEDAGLDILDQPQD